MKTSESKIKSLQEKITEQDIVITLAAEKWEGVQELKKHEIDVTYKSYFQEIDQEKHRIDADERSIVFNFNKNGSQFDRDFVVDIERNYMRRFKEDGDDRWYNDIKYRVSSSSSYGLDHYVFVGKVATILKSCANEILNHANRIEEKYKDDLAKYQNIIDDAKKRRAEFVNDIKRIQEQDTLEEYMKPEGVEFKQVADRWGSMKYPEFFYTQRKKEHNVNKFRVDRITSTRKTAHVVVTCEFADWNKEKQDYSNIVHRTYEHRISMQQLQDFIKSSSKYRK